LYSFTAKSGCFLSVLDLSKTIFFSFFYFGSLLPNSFFFLVFLTSELSIGAEGSKILRNGLECLFVLASMKDFLYF